MTAAGRTILEEIKHADTKAADWIAKRNRLIIQAHREGVSLRAIAAATSITHDTISKIIKKAGPA